VRRGRGREPARDEGSLHIVELHAPAWSPAGDAAKIYTVLAGEFAGDGSTSDASCVAFCVARCERGCPEYARRTRGIGRRGIGSPRIGHARRRPRSSRILRGGFDPSDLIADNRPALGLHQDLRQAPGGGRLDFNDRFFGFDFQQRLTRHHAVADLLEPADDPHFLHDEADFRNFLRNLSH
jgi:hypothetical protein